MENEYSEGRVFLNLNSIKGCFFGRNQTKGILFGVKSSGPFFLGQHNLCQNYRRSGEIYLSGFFYRCFPPPVEWASRLYFMPGGPSGCEPKACFQSSQKRPNPNIVEISMEEGSSLSCWKIIIIASPYNLWSWWWWYGNVGLSRHAKPSSFRW